MNTMEQAFASAKPNTQSPASKPATRTTAVRLTAGDIRARRLARLTGKADAVQPIDDESVTDFVEISAELRAYEHELGPLTKKGSTIPVEQLNAARAEIESRMTECREELAVLTQTYPLIVARAAKREELRASAQSDIRAFQRLDPENFDREAVQHMLNNAVLNGTLKSDGDSYVAAVEDPILQELAGRVGFFFSAVKTVREEEQAERTERVSDYLLSDRRSAGGGDSLLDTEKKKPGKVSLTRLLAGEGERAFVPVHGTNQGSGEEYFMGEVLIENRDGKPMVIKGTRVNLCEKTFFSYNRAKNERQERGIFLVPANLETLHPKFLRDALQLQLMKDAESSDRREKATLLATVENYKDVISFSDLRIGEKGRWVVNAQWTPAGKQKGSYITLHVESDGKNFFIGDAACDLEGVDKTFFGMYTKSTPLSALTTDKRWLALAAQNREFETGWQLRKAASKHGKVVFITKNNSAEVANALGLEGVDGVYAATARWEQQTKERSDAPKYVPIGFIVERRGEKVAITFATPGTAEGLVEKEQDAYPVSNLPVMTRAVLRAVWMAAKRDFGTVPEHLKAVHTAK